MKLFSLPIFLVNTPRFNNFYTFSVTQLWQKFKNNCTHQFVFKHCKSLGCHQFSKIPLLTDVIKMAELKKIGGNDEVN